MNQKLELIKHKAEVNNLKIETNLLQREQMKRMHTLENIYSLLKFFKSFGQNLFGFCSLLELLNQNL